MKISDVKKEIFKLTCIADTKRLKKERPDLTNGKDLRYKEQWLAILDQVKYLQIQGLDLSLADLDDSEQMLKASLFKVGRMARLNECQLDFDWQIINLESQFSDIHIEQL
ncbi:hypothetical protein [Chamaesiphon sp. OTE_75_metabat_556]|uniref:hypothetical protein n=1 Tax=Chamaesiphon sp. OTE_75_metabat_556 TaxID=2964692 RepID=UPI00286A5669|nr:hypothetical protein [Chamaesiphon sp. OTE_75_metabat_556]